MEKDEVIDYLANGGLWSMLRVSSDGISRRAWLGRAPTGTISHRFDASMGGIGGGFVPCLALQNGTIFERKTVEVLAFVKSFGLDEREAEHVLRSARQVPLTREEIERRRREAGGRSLPEILSSGLAPCSRGRPHSVVDTRTSLCGRFFLARLPTDPQCHAFRDRSKFNHERFYAAIV